MDALIYCGDAINDTLALLNRPLIDRDLPIVFYDLTTIRTEGQSESAGELRQYGLAKESDIARQAILGVVKTVEGLPIHNELFAGNAAEPIRSFPRSGRCWRAIRSGVWCWSRTGGSCRWTI